MKTCPKCSTLKPFAAFSAKKTNTDGLQAHCRKCCAKYAATWRAANAERKRQMDRDYAAANAERARAKTKKWTRENPDRKRATDRAYAKEKADQIKERGIAYRQANADSIREAKRHYARENRARILERQKAYRQANRGLILADRAFRKAAKRQATPPWLTKAHRAEIAGFYKRAVALSQATGVPHHVDHIYPIRGKKSCGLHVPWNLQILTAEENLKKGNSEPD